MPILKERNSKVLIMNDNQLIKKEDLNKTFSK